MSNKYPTQPKKKFKGNIYEETIDQQIGEVAVSRTHPLNSDRKLGFNKYTGKMGYYLEKDLETDPTKIEEYYNKR